jgi:hypothetical protein
MKRLLLTALLGAATVLNVSAGEPDLPKVTHYGLRVEFLLKENRIRVEAALTIRNNSTAAQQEIPLLLYRLLEIRGVTDGHGTPLPFEQDIVQFSDGPSLQARSASVRLTRPLEPNDTAQFVVTYEGYIFGYAEAMAYVRDRIDDSYSLLRPDALAYPMLARASHASNLRAYDTKFTYDIRATVPKGYTAVCGGEMTGSSPRGPDSTAFVFRSKVPTWRIDLAVAPFAVLGDVRDKLLVYYVPGDSAGAGRVLEASRRVIGFYSGLFGRPKRYQGYTVIEIPDGWGSQASDFYFLQTGAAFKDSSRIGEVYHEIGHSWNATPAVSVKRCRYFDEAFAQYFESLALRHFEGEQRFTGEMERTRKNFVLWGESDAQVFNTPIAAYGEKELGRHSYTKGAWSLYVLQRLVGDEVFAAIIRALLAEPDGTTVDFAGYARICERVSGRSLKKYFDEWIYGTESSKLLADGVPVAEIVKRY